MYDRLNYARQSPELTRKLTELSLLVRKSPLEPLLHHLVDLRASQLNGCAFCVDMHTKEALIDGERPLRLYHLPVWRESPLFSEREKAALAWTEALTRLSPHGIGDGLYQEVESHFPADELSALTFAIMAINSWNRAGVAFLPEPGSQDKAYGLDKAGLA
jgi:AhpD family alkylhydroperoxidase